jgi:hypothetical protein
VDSNGAHTNVAIHVSGVWSMPRYYEPDLTVDPNSPFVRDATNKLVRRGYWMDMNDRTLVIVMTQGIGANLSNDEKRAHLADLKREHLIDQVCTQEILPPER